MSLRPRTFNFMYHNKIKKLLQCHELLVCQNENEKLITQYNILKYYNIYIYTWLYCYVYNVAIHIFTYEDRYNNT